MAHENLDQEVIDLLVELTGEDELGDYRDVDFSEEQIRRSDRIFHDVHDSGSCCRTVCRR